MHTNTFIYLIYPKSTLQHLWVKRNIAWPSNVHICQQYNHRGPHRPCNRGTPSKIIQNNGVNYYFYILYKRSVAYRKKCMHAFYTNMCLTWNTPYGTFKTIQKIKPNWSGGHMCASRTTTFHSCQTSKSENKIKGSDWTSSSPWRQGPPANPLDAIHSGSQEKPQPTTWSPLPPLSTHTAHQQRNV